MDIEPDSGEAGETLIDRQPGQQPPLLLHDMSRHASTDSQLSATSSDRGQQHKP